MITDADVKKLKAIFATKEELKSLNSKMDSGFIEIIQFIGEIKGEIITNLNVFRNEMNEFRNEIRDVNRNSQSMLNNHESRITHLEYINKPS